MKKQYRIVKAERVGGDTIYLPQVFQGSSSKPLEVQWQNIKDNCVTLLEAEGFITYEQKLDKERENKRIVKTDVIREYH